MRRLDTLLATLAVAAFIGAGGAMAITAPPPLAPRLSGAALPTRPPPGELVEGTVGPILTLDPQFAASPAERSIAALLFRGLTRLGPDDAIVPDLADSWEVDPGGTTWTFHLGGDDRWHDRVLVSADDVVTTVATLQDSAYSGPAGADWRGVVAERVDRFTARFHLPTANAAFLGATTQPLVPAHLVAGIPVEDRPAGPLSGAPVGNGPFAFARRTADEVVLERFGAPPGGHPATFEPVVRAPLPEPTPARRPASRPRLDAIRLRIYADTTALAAGFEAGEVDAAAGLPPDVAARLAAAPDVTGTGYADTRSLALVPNLRFTDRQLRDAAVRRALSTAIDREGIVDQVFAGWASASTSLAPEGWELYDHQVAATVEHDLEVARNGLLAAGWTQVPGGWDAPEGEDPVGLEIVVADDPTRPYLVAAAEAVARDWGALGITVDVTALTPQVLVEERIRPGDFDIALLEIDPGVEPDIHPLLLSSEVAPGGANVGGYQSTIMDGLLAQTRQPAERAVRADRWRDLQAALAREMPIIPLIVPEEPYLTRGTLVGPSPRRVSGPGDRFWDVLAWRTVSAPDD